MDKYVNDPDPAFAPTPRCFDVYVVSNRSFRTSDRITEQVNTAQESAKRSRYCRASSIIGTQLDPTVIGIMDMLVTVLSGWGAQRIVNL